MVERAGGYVPVEVKWTDAPTPRDARHLHVFLEGYASAERGFVACRAPRRMRLSDRVEALPWQEIEHILA